MLAITLPYHRAAEKNDLSGGLTSDAAGSASVGGMSDPKDEASAAVAVAAAVSLKNWLAQVLDGLDPELVEQAHGCFVGEKITTLEGVANSAADLIEDEIPLEWKDLLGRIAVKKLMKALKEF